MNYRFRKAADGGNLIVIGVAIGAIVLIGMFMLAQDMGESVSNTQTNMFNGVQAGLDELTK